MIALCYRSICTGSVLTTFFCIRLPLRGRIGFVDITASCIIHESCWNKTKLVPFCNMNALILVLAFGWIVCGVRLIYAGDCCFNPISVGHPHKQLLRTIRTPYSARSEQSFPTAHTSLARANMKNVCPTMFFHSDQMTKQMSNFTRPTVCVCGWVIVLSKIALI